MRTKYLILFACLSLLGNSCITTNKQKNTREEEFILVNKERMADLAAWAILYCRENNTHEIATKDITDKKVRRQMKLFATSVSVVYTAKNSDEMDSTVVFSQSVPVLGLREYIFDFASTPRLTTAKPIKLPFRGRVTVVTDRICITRSELPMM